MDNENMSTQTQNEDNTKNTEPKTFTQEEVNKMMADRVARVKADKEQEYTAKLAELEKKEFKMQAAEVLRSKGMPDTLLEAVNCSDMDTFKKSVDIIDKYVNEVRNKPVKLKGTVPGYTPKQGIGYDDTDIEIRRKMGLFH